MDNLSYQNTAYYAAQHPYQYQQSQQYSHQPSSWQSLPQANNLSLPPWRTNAQLMPTKMRPSKNQARRVDSWRSYSNDATNLQTTTAPPVNLNGGAAAFEPSPRQNSDFKPYESLRVSNGTAERRVVEANNAAQGQIGKSSRKKNKNPSLGVTPTDAFASRYPVRSTRGIADIPLPSIEASDATISARSDLPIRHVKARQTPARLSAVPTTTDLYNADAHKQPVRLTEPRKLLVVLDLNGTLLYRNRSAGTAHVRPGLAPFIDYLFENHTVMIYTSAKPENAEIMVKSFLHPTHRRKLAGFWARDKLGLTAFEYRNKVQVYKKLDKIWNDQIIQKSAEPGARWGQSNTVLIDDSQLKALSQPFNLVQVAEYTSEDDPRKAGKDSKASYDNAYRTQVNIMQELQLKIEELKYQADVSRLIRQWQLGEADVLHSVPTAIKMKEIKPIVGSHLPTPESLADEIEGGVSLQSSGKEKDGEQERSGSVSSIDESVFRELLEGTGK